MAIASGSEFRVSYALEKTRGTTPAGVGTQVTNVGTDKTSAAAGECEIDRASGSWITDGFREGQMVLLDGFGNANDGTWLIKSVDSALIITVYDNADAMSDDAVDPGQSAEIHMITARLTGRNIKATKDELQSEEARSSRQEKDVRHGFRSVTGTVSGELNYKDFDDWFRIAIAGTWHQPTLVSGINLGIDKTSAAAGECEIDRASGSFTDDGYRAGDIIVTTGFTGANSGIYRVKTPGTTTMTVFDPSDAMSDEASGAGRTLGMQGERMDIGSVLESMTMERAATTVGMYEVFKGVTINQVNGSIQPNAIINFGFELLGINFNNPAGSQIQTAAPLAASSESPFSAFDGAAFIDSAANALITGFDFTLNNRREAPGVVGQAFGQDLVEGTLELTGSATMMFENSTLLSKFHSEGTASIWVKLQDIGGTHFYDFRFHNVKFQDADIDPPQTGVAPVTLPFRALESDQNGVGAGVTVATAFTFQKSTLQTSRT